MGGSHERLKWVLGRPSQGDGGAEVRQTRGSGGIREDGVFFSFLNFLGVEIWRNVAAFS
jgi:hypothetical protein